MIIDSTPEEPTPNIRGTVRDTYLKWLNDCTMVRCIMRASMNDELSQMFEEAQSEKMHQVLRDSFGTPDDVERHKTNCTIFNVWMREDASVIDNVLYMIEQIKKLSKLGFSLHE